MPVNITLSKHAGFCAGVNRAFDKACQVSERPAYMFGDLVNNDAVIERLKDDYGIESILATTSALRRISEGVLIIPTHGACPDDFDEAKRRGLTVVDATCEKVGKIHQLVDDLRKRAYQILIVGTKDHQEVRGICGWAGEEALVISDKNPKEAEEVRLSPGRVGIVFQTTLGLDIVNSVTSILRSRRPDIDVYPTTCSVVQRRQASVREVAEQNEVVVIIGDKKSKNTDELHRISKAINSKTYFVQNTSELRGSWFKGIDSVGIETGTSAAPWTIEEIVEAVKRFDE